MCIKLSVHHCPSETEEFCNLIIDLLPPVIFMCCCVTCSLFCSTFSFVSSLLLLHVLYLSSLFFFYIFFVILNSLVFFVPFSHVHILFKNDHHSCKICIQDIFKILLPKQIFHYCLK